MGIDLQIFDRANNSLYDLSTYGTRSFTKRLNRPASGRFRVPSELVPNLRAGYCAGKMWLDGNIQLNGIVWFLDDDGDQNSMYTEGLIVDPMIWWKYRFARDADGDLSLPHFMTDFETGPQIIQAIVQNSIDIDGQLGLDVSSGSFESGGTDLSGAPVDWPAMIGDIATALTDTGACDIVVTPVDTDDGYPPHIMGVLNAYNGFYGSDRRGSVSFDYETGEYNVRQMKRTEDMSTIGNALIYYFAPKVSIQRYRGNITYPGGQMEDQAFQAILNSLIEDSRAQLGKFSDFRVYDTSLDFPLIELKRLYGPLWQSESLLRVKPRELISVIPDRGIMPAFGLGDQISISAGPKFRGGVPEVGQRVYEYTVSQGEDSVTEISEIITSADQESSV